MFCKVTVNKKPHWTYASSHKQARRFILVRIQQAEEKECEILELKKQGIPMTKIASKLGICYSAVKLAVKNAA